MSYSNSSTSSSHSGVFFSSCNVLKPISEQNKVSYSSICLCTLSYRLSHSCRLLYAGHSSSSKQKLSKSRNITTKPGVNLYFIFDNVAALKLFTQLISPRLFTWRLFKVFISPTKYRILKSVSVKARLHQDC